MKETTSKSANVPRVKPPLGNFSQICTVLFTALAFLYNQPVLVLIATIIMALNALIPAASPYRLLYQYVLVPLDLLKPYPGEEGKLASYHLSRISTVLLLVSTALLFLTPLLTPRWGFGIGLGWMIDVIVGIVTIWDMGIRFSIWTARGIFGSR